MKKKNISNKFDEDLDLEDLQKEEEQKEEINVEDLKKNAYVMTKICNGFILTNIYDEKNSQYTINNLVTLISCSIFHLLNHLPPSEVAKVLNYCFSVGENIFWEQERNISRKLYSDEIEKNQILPKIDKSKLN